MPELLLELLSEEIPARMQLRAAEDLKRLFIERLKGSSLTFTDARVYVTPRRLTLVVDGLPEKQPDVVEEKKGPRVGAPEQAIQGFLKGAGLASLNQCEKRTVGKAEFWFAVSNRSGRATVDLLPEMINAVAQALPWPKSMRWGGNRRLWVRPLARVLCVFNGRIVEGGLATDPGALAFGDMTTGHRFIAPKPFRATRFAEYREKLFRACVILDQEERRDSIRRQVEALATREGLKVRDDPALLDEITGLVEWPVALLGHIDESYMGLPPEVLTTTMRANQRYFALLDTEGRLAPQFVVVANVNGDATTRASITHGHERVLRARLSDAKFFWDQDRKTPLEERVPALAARMFHAKLGTMADKVQRLQALAAELAPSVPGADVDRVRSAALLCKADLSSGMVGEFPELQGIMGRYYALHDGEKPEVADAIRDHYAPLGPNDRCPTAPVSVVVSLADKLDSLVGFFAVDEKPTGSKDPFALRRAALGVIRLLIENDLRLPLVSVFKTAHRLLAEQNLKLRSTGEVADELLEFFADRLKVALRERGVRHDLIDAVFALSHEDDLVRLLARVDALKNFLATEDGANLLVACRRASNIVAIEEKKDRTTYDGTADAALLTAAEERALHGALQQALGEVRPALGREDFVAAMQALARLRTPVDRFFDKVTVNTPEAALRANRLRLLSEIRRTLGEVADFARIEG